MKKYQMKKRTSFVCFFWFVGWTSISLGVSICIAPIHIEFHLPFGFIKIGLAYIRQQKAANYSDVAWRGFGLQEKYLSGQ